ncbi:Protein of unknown function [Bacillus mycoides]|nr:Protein of unknown function [Bacillus mycoides]
MKEMAIGM